MSSDMSAFLITALRSDMAGAGAQPPGQRSGGRARLPAARHSARQRAAPPPRPGVTHPRRPPLPPPRTLLALAGVLGSSHTLPLVPHPYRTDLYLLGTYCGTTNRNQLLVPYWFRSFYHDISRLY